MAVFKSLNLVKKKSPREPRSRLPGFASNPLMNKYIFELSGIYWRANFEGFRGLLGQDIFFALKFLNRAP
jgi:hypothetical protein